MDAITYEKGLSSGEKSRFSFSRLPKDGKDDQISWGYGALSFEGSKRPLERPRMYAYKIMIFAQEAESIWGSPALLEAWMRFLALLLSVVAVLGYGEEAEAAGWPHDHAYRVAPNDFWFEKCSL